MADEGWRERNQVDPSFRYGSNFSIGSYCVIGEDVVVGDDVEIGNFVLLKSGTVIGDRVFVDSYVRSSGDNLIGSDVTLRFGSTIARKVTIEDGVFISPNVMTIFSRHTGTKSAGTVIGANSHIGTNAVVGPDVTIPPGTVVGTLAYVHRSIDEAAIYGGIPARKIRDLD